MMQSGAASACNQDPACPRRLMYLLCRYVLEEDVAMRGVVKKWGNSAAVRIPASVLEATQVGLDQPVDVREEGGRIVIELLFNSIPRNCCRGMRETAVPVTALIFISVKGRILDAPRKFGWGSRLSSDRACGCPDRISTNDTRSN